MSSGKKILVLDLGMQAIRLAEFSSNPGGKLRLLWGTQKDLLLDPALETTRSQQVQLALRDIIKEWKPQARTVSLILPAHTVFTKVAPLEVPGGNLSQIKALVTFEAQHNIPFPLEEVVWDYVVIGQTPAGALNVVYIAIKTDVLEELCRSVSSVGLEIASISASPLALYDAFLHAYPEESLSATSLLLDIGSRTSNLIIVSPGSFFSRSIPSGGLAVTSAISKDMHLDLEEAETLKISQGQVALGPNFAPPENPVEANLGRLARHALLKTQADISRSLSYYRSTLSGADPLRIFLTGGMASMPYLAEFLTEKLQKETLFFEPLRNVSVSEMALPFTEAHPNNLGELLGGALSITDHPRTTPNLLPPFLIKKREIKKRLPWLASAVGVFFLTLIFWYGYAQKATSVTNSESEKIVASIQEEGSVAAQIDKQRASLSSVNKTSSQLLSLVQLRNAYPSILAELNDRIPVRFLWITEIQPVRSLPEKGAPKNAPTSVRALSIKGLYLNNPRQAAVIDDFVTALEGSSIFLVEEKEKSKIITQRSSPNGQYWAYPFSLTLPLRTPIPSIP